MKTTLKKFSDSGIELVRNENKSKSSKSVYDIMHEGNVTDIHLCIVGEEAFITNDWNDGKVSVGKDCRDGIKFVLRILTNEFKVGDEIHAEDGISGIDGTIVATNNRNGVLLEVNKEEWEEMFDESDVGIDKQEGIWKDEGFDVSKSKLDRNKYTYVSYGVEHLSRISN